MGRVLESRSRVDEGVIGVDYAVFPIRVKKGVSSSWEGVSVCVMTTKKTSYRVVEGWIRACVFLEEA